MEQPTEEDIEFIDLRPNLYDPINAELFNCTLRLKEQRKPRLIFTDEKEQFRVSLLSCILDGELEQEDEHQYKPEYSKEREFVEPPALRLVDLVEANQVWVIIIVHGGYYSGAVFAKGKVVVHKSGHRYVNRKKNGGRQSNKDKKGNNGRRPQSAGASIRRFNEEKHRIEIKELLTKWEEHIKKADKVFLHAPGPQNKKLLFYEGSPLAIKQRHSPRKIIQSIPFTTCKPLFSEVMAAFEQLSSLCVQYRAPTTCEFATTNTTACEEHLSAQGHSSQLVAA